MNTRPTAKAVVNACHEALAALGARSQYQVATLQLSADFSAWFGLNIGTHKSFIRVNPFVGIHAGALMKVAATAAGERYRAGESATYAVHLGELCSEVPQFIFASEADLPTESARLAQAIAEFGIPYAQTLASYEALLPRLLARVPMLGGMPQRYAIALALHGQRAAAEAFLHAQIAQFRGGHDPRLVAQLESILAWLPA